MALVERLMHLDPDPARNMSVHTFFAAITEVQAGQLTAAQVQTYLAMTAADIAEWDAIAALMPTGSTATAMANKALWMSRVHAVFILAEQRAPLYSTPAEVRARLGI